MHPSATIFSLVCFSELATFIVLDDQYSLQCVSNYLSNITCSLNVSDGALENETSSCLHFSTHEEHHLCILKREKQTLECEMDLSPNVIFSDEDSYQITYHHGYHANTSIVLDEDFMPSKNVRPLAPSNLSVLWEKDGALFQWQSGYEHEAFAFLRSLFISRLQYQLRLNSKHQVNEVESIEQSVYVDQSMFTPYTNYTLRVRSQPDQEHYMGVWSQWSPGVHCNSGSIYKDIPEQSFQNAWCFLFLPLVLLCCVSYFRLRTDDYIPSPEPYFKDWEREVQMHSVTSREVSDVMKGEESLPIDIMTELSQTPPLPASEHENIVKHQDSPSCMCSKDCCIREDELEELRSITYSEDYCTL